MQRSRMRFLTAALGAAMLFVAMPTFAQNTEQKAGDKDKSQAGEAKDVQKKIDEFAEAERLLGGPAANPECVWLGRRVVSLLWRDDLDTAFRHLDLYDRFGCPGGHIQATFRCVVRQGNIDPKASEGLSGRVHACWINPAPDAPAPVPSSPASLPVFPILLTRARNIPITAIGRPKRRSAPISSCSASTPAPFVPIRRPAASSRWQASPPSSG